MQRLGVRYALAYVAPALVLWVCVFKSGVHATIAGVALGLLTPVTDARGRRVIDALEHRLHPWTSFVVVPVFVLANAGIVLGSDAVRAAASSSVTWGVATGLVVGKTVGIVAATAVCLGLGLSRLPEGSSFRQLVGVATLAGIGFTVSLFIADRSFVGARLGEAKIGILAGSLLAGIAGTGVLALRARRTLPRRRCVMQGNTKVLEALADLLAAELSAASTYFVHAKMRDNWGYPDLAKRAYDDSIEEMRHAEKLIERIIYFEKTPNLQRLNRIRVGDGVTDQFENELTLEKGTVDGLVAAIALCREVGDDGSRLLFEPMLADGEESIDWLETQLDLIGKLGESSYLAQHLRNE